MAEADAKLLAQGVVTASAGNMAQGVAWNARRIDVSCTVVVPDHAPETKLSAISRLGGQVQKVPFDSWWNIINTHESGHPGHFVHPVCDADVIAGNGTIGLEILEDLPEVDTIIVPFGGGGLISGIASAVRALKSDTRIIASEVSTGAPLRAAFDAGAPKSIDYEPSFVDGIGSTSVLPAMWPLVNRLVDDVLVATPEAIADSVRLLIERNQVVAEGAGAAAIATALAHKNLGEKIVCIVSGGNIDTGKLVKILGGITP